MPPALSLPSSRQNSGNANQSPGQRHRRTRGTGSTVCTPDRSPGSRSRSRTRPSRVGTCQCRVSRAADLVPEGELDSFLDEVASSSRRTTRSKIPLDSMPRRARSTSRPNWRTAFDSAGFVDRIDVAPTGEVRVVDYKTGKAPREFTESKALFQMKFYALVLLRTRGIVPHNCA